MLWSFGRRSSVVGRRFIVFFFKETHFKKSNSNENRVKGVFEDADHEYDLHFFVRPRPRSNSAGGGSKFYFHRILIKIDTGGFSRMPITNMTLIFFKFSLLKCILIKMDEE